ncbi:alpha/beta fold hydrolase [Acuticoccus yangtzensis]|uniref:alpha/beta fold hydrolase n=1 Tax=Acuticoccus yangtzensis TaxID=1443441 RepID=UPI001115336D|nr:alpha/beta fold hydrolase [Acuticoccus yangtzensis]
MAASTWGSVDLGGTIGTLHAGAKLRVAHWPGTTKGAASGDGPGTVLLVQGRGEFIEVYGETIADFCRRGFAVVTYDHRDQGGSQRRLRRGGHVAGYKHYADDLVGVVRHAAHLGLPRPFYVVAHSMGALTALVAAPRLTGEVARMVLIAPPLHLVQLPASAGMILAATTIAGLTGFDKKRVGPADTRARPFAENRITSDPARYETLARLTDGNPDLTVGAPTLGWVRATITAGRRVLKGTGLPLPVPALFIAAGRDEIVSTPVIDRFARSAPGSGGVLIPGARHHLLLERDELRDLAFAAIDAFITHADLGESARSVPPRIGRAPRFEAAPSSGTGRLPVRPLPRVVPAAAPPAAAHTAVPQSEAVEPKAAPPAAPQSEAPHPAAAHTGAAHTGDAEAGRGAGATRLRKRLAGRSARISGETESASEAPAAASGHPPAPTAGTPAAPRAPAESPVQPHGAAPESEAPARAGQDAHPQSEPDRAIDDVVKATLQIIADPASQATEGEQPGTPERDRPSPPKQQAEAAADTEKAGRPRTPARATPQVGSPLPLDPATRKRREAARAARRAKASGRPTPPANGSTADAREPVDPPASPIDRNAKPEAPKAERSAKAEGAASAEGAAKAESTAATKGAVKTEDAAATRSAARLANAALETPHVTGVSPSPGRYAAAPVSPSTGPTTGGSATASDFAPHKTAPVAPGQPAIAKQTPAHPDAAATSGTPAEENTAPPAAALPAARPLEPKPTPPADVASAPDGTSTAKAAPLAAAAPKADPAPQADVAPEDDAATKAGSESKVGAESKLGPATEAGAGSNADSEPEADAATKVNPAPAGRRSPGLAAGAMERGADAAQGAIDIAQASASAQTAREIASTPAPRSAPRAPEPPHDRQSAQQPRGNHSEPAAGDAETASCPKQQTGPAAADVSDAAGMRHEAQHAPSSIPAANSSTERKAASAAPREVDPTAHRAPPAPEGAENGTSSHTERTRRSTEAPGAVPPTAAPRGDEKPARPRRGVWSRLRGGPGTPRAAEVPPAKRPIFTAKPKSLSAGPAAALSTVHQTPQAGAPSPNRPIASTPSETRPSGTPPAHVVGTSPAAAARPSVATAADTATDRPAPPAATPPPIERSPTAEPARPAPSGPIAAQPRPTAPVPAQPRPTGPVPAQPTPSATATAAPRAPKPGPAATTPARADRAGIGPTLSANAAATPTRAEDDPTHAAPVVREDATVPAAPEAPVPGPSAAAATSKQAEPAPADPAPSASAAATPTRAEDEPTYAAPVVREGATAPAAEASEPEHAAGPTTPGQAEAEPAEPTLSATAGAASTRAEGEPTRAEAGALEGEPAPAAQGAAERERAAGPAPAMAAPSDVAAVRPVDEAVRAAAEPAAPELGSVEGRIDGGTTSPTPFPHSPAEVTAAAGQAPTGAASLGTAPGESLPIEGGAFATDHLPIELGQMDADNGLFTTDWLNFGGGTEEASGATTTMWVPIPEQHPKLPQEPYRADEGEPEPEAPAAEPERRKRMPIGPGRLLRRRP